MLSAITIISRDGRRRGQRAGSGCARAGQRAVLLWGGGGIVSRASTSRMALDALWPETEIVSFEIGGFYVLDVMVYRYSDGRRIKSFRVPMVYAAPSALAASAWRSDEQLHNDLARTKETILNVSRLCFGLP